MLTPQLPDYPAHLHIDLLPEAQGQGVGTELLDVAKRASERLQLWTFQCNASARRFYEARGFALVEETDGTRDDVLSSEARAWLSISTTFPWGE